MGGYLTIINKYPTNKIQQYRKAFSKVSDLTEEASRLMDDYADICEEEIIRLLHTLFKINSQSLFDKVFQGKTTFDKFFQLLKKFDEEEYDIDIITELIDEGNSYETSFPIHKSLEAVSNILTEIINDPDKKED